MKNRIISSLTAMALLPTGMTFTAVAAETKPDSALWDKFIKYDLCITDFDGLTEEQQELCHYIFDTEQAANDNIICERARRTLAGDDVGERITLEQLESAYGIADVYSPGFTSDWDYYINCVPDIIRMGDGTEADPYSIGIKEYWLDENRSAYVEFNEQNSLETTTYFSVYDSSDTLIETIPALIDFCPYKNYRGDEEWMEKYGYIEKNGGYYFVKDDGTAIFECTEYYNNFDDEADAVTEPFVVESEINGCPVASIEDDAFARSPYTEIILPDSVKKIGGYAFSSCKYLQKVNFPKGLEYIGERLFLYSTSVENITIDCPNLYVADRAFFDCTSLKSVELNVRETGEQIFSEIPENLTLGNDIKKIGYKAFYGMKGIYVIEIPEGVEVIGQEAFANSSIEVVTIPPTVKVIGAYPHKTPQDSTSGIEPPPPRRPLTDKQKCVFDSECAIRGYKGTEAERYAEEWKLGFINLSREIVEEGKCGENVTYTLDSYGLLTISGTGEIDKEAFSDNTNIKSVCIENGITGIGDSAFVGCLLLQNIEIPDTVTKIEMGAFAVSGIRSLEIPDSVTSIGNSAFFRCESLKEVIIPDSVTDMGRALFDGCQALTDVKLPESLDNISDGTFNNCTSLTTVTIPDSVTSIGEKAFYGCTSLKNIIIPDSVKSVGKEAFYKCIGLTEITFPESVESIGDLSAALCSSLTSVTILNPDCETERLMFHDYVIPYLTFYGYEGSTAQAYAEKYGLEFAVLNEKTLLYGDANCDENVSLADAVLILQTIASPDVYGVNGTSENHITELGMVNADVYEVGTGLTPQDSLSIQKYLLKLISKLPE